jgi:hypothetical protein
MLKATGQQRRPDSGEPAERWGAKRWAECTQRERLPTCTHLDQHFFASCHEMSWREVRKSLTLCEEEIGTRELCPLLVGLGSRPVQRGKKEGRAKVLTVRRHGGLPCSQSDGWRQAVEVAKHSSVARFAQEKLGGKSEEALWGFKGSSTGRRLLLGSSRAWRKWAFGWHAHSGGGKQREVAVRLMGVSHCICIVQGLSKAPNFEIHKCALHDLWNSWNFLRWSNRHHGATFLFSSTTKSFRISN